MKKAIVLTIAVLLLTGFGASLSFGQNKIAVIDLSGNIKPSEGSAFSASGITPGKVRSLNENAVKQGADAILYEINSGGGAVVASKEVYRSIEDVEVPTVCRMRDISASGGYLISLGCDRVIADPVSLTGSIGVKSSYVEVSGLLDKLGAEYVNITAGKRKDLGSRFQNASKQDRKLLKDKIDIVHEEFLKMVQQERNLSDEQISEVRTGEPFLGREAMKLDLIDGLGGREEAIKAAENMTGKELNTFKVETSSGFNILSLLAAKASFGSWGGNSAFDAEWR